MKVGVLGGGQLGQMLALAGYPLGIHVSCFDGSADAPAGLVAPLTAGELTETAKLRHWAANVDVLTYEFENFPVEIVSYLTEVRPALPPPGALAVAQDRWAEKRMFTDLKIPVTPFRTVSNTNEMTEALRDLGLPVVIKTRTGGYDGKGQVVLRGEEEREAMEALMAQGDVIVEKLVNFDSELSIIGVRNARGEVAMYPLVINEHREGILRTSIVPSSFPKDILDDARAHMMALLMKLDYVGVLTLELFLEGKGLLANEMAPRVHNSGHWTIEGAETSQFENHLRAIAGLPLGSTEVREAVAMVNLIGSVPSVPLILAIPGTHVHLYGKTPRPNRKLGHVTITGPDEATVKDRVSKLGALIDGHAT